MTADLRQSNSYDLLSEVLLARGYQVQELAIGQKYCEFTAPGGGTWLTKKALLMYPFVTRTAGVLGSNKQLSNGFAAFHNVETPKSVYVSEQANDMADFLSQYAPVVVKPADSLGSRGLTLNVTQVPQLQSALARALEYSKKAIVQQQFSGEEVRVTVSRGKVVSAILRQTPRVVGDGTSTVAELIAAENAERSRIDLPYISYPQLSAENIPERWLTDAHMPSKGEIVELSRSTMVKTGASLYNITDSLHEGYKDLAVRLAGKLNPDFLCIDFMINDYKIKPAPQEYIFLEITTSPALKMYYSSRDGKHCDILSLLADLIDEYCTNQV